MGRKWQDRDEAPIRWGAPEPTLEEKTRTLDWDEIAGLIEIGPDGSWRPTDFGKAKLFKLERNRNSADYVQ